MENGEGDHLRNGHTDMDVEKLSIEQSGQAGSFVKQMEEATEVHDFHSFVSNLMPLVVSYRE